MKQVLNIMKLGRTMSEDLTIIIPSYNKEKYIKEALESIFKQKTDYSYKIIVADDCSNDKTIDIVREFQKNYPDKITLLTSDKNNKLYKNIIRAYKLIKTPYFCVLDADDYWYSDNFIQSALNFLERNNDFTIYISNVYKQTLDGKLEKYSNHKSQKTSFEDYLNGIFPFTQTSGCIYRNVVFKNGVPDKLLHPPEKSWEVSFRGDTFRNLIHLNKGFAYNCESFDTVYRITDEGLWQGITQLEQVLLNATVYKDFYLYFDKKYPKFLLLSYSLYKNAESNFLKNFLNISSEFVQNKAINEVKSLYRCYKESEKELKENQGNDSILKKLIKRFIKKFKI